MKNRYTYADIQEIRAGLLALGQTYSKVLKQGAQEQVVNVPYKYGAKSLAVRSAAARNLRLLKPHVEEYDERRNAILEEVSEGAGFIGDDDHERAAAFRKQLRALEQSQLPEDLDLLPIAGDDLDLANNPIPPAVVMALGLIAPKEDLEPDA